MSLINAKTPYILRLAYQQPKAERLRRIAVVKPRNNDIFISYAAQDGEFVRRLDKSIRDYGFDPWIDFDDIPNFDNSLEDTSIYTNQIKSGILGADVFVLVLSQSALNCSKTLQELQLAQRLNKLIILLCKDPSDEFQQIKSILDDLQYLDFRSSINDVFEQVALNIIHLQTYTRLLARAIEWNRRGRRQSYLLTPEDLKAVKKQKRWIETHKLGEQFQFTQLQKEFLDTVNQVHETSQYFRRTPPDIFVSYARSNESFVEDLNQALKDARWKVWIDQDRIPVAANWRDEAEEGIRYAHTLIFIVCPKSLTSKNCQWELEKARKYKKRIIPVVSNNEYDRDVFHDIGFSSIQYVSFARKNKSFRESLETLLDALKENLEDLKIYRRLLLKSYEWAEHERSDGFLMPRHEYREIKSWYKQRQNILENNKQELEPLLSRQKEYIQASQRYLALQRKRQSFFVSAVVGVVSGLSFLLLTTTFSEIRALVKSLDDLKELDALVIGIQTGKRITKSDFLVRFLRPDLRSKATTAIHRTALKLREINRLNEHSGEVLSVEFSPDAQQMVSIGSDEALRWWNFHDTHVEPSKVHTDSILTAAYSSDGKSIAAGNEDGDVMLWISDGEAFKEYDLNLMSLENPDKLPSQGSELLIVAKINDFYHVRVFDINGEIVLDKSNNEFSSNLVLTQEIESAFNTITRGETLDIETKKDLIQKVTLSLGTPSFKQLEQTHEKSVNQVLFSPGSQYLLSAGEDGKIFLWTQEDNFEKPAVITHSADEPISVVAFSPRSRYFASADFQGQVKLWNLEGKLIKTFQHEKLRLFNIDPLSDDTSIFTMQFSPDGSLLAFAGASGVIQVENLRDGTTQWLADHDDSIYQIAFSSDGFTLASASADATVKLWKKSENGQDKQLAHTLRGHQGPIYRLRFGPQDDVVATGGADGIIRLWLTDKGTLIDSFEGHKDIISSLAFSPKPTLGYQLALASSSNDGDIRLWNIESPIQPLPHNNRVFDVAFRPDGRVVASSGINTIRLWREEEATLRSHIEFGKSSEVYALDYSLPDGNLLVAGDSQGQIKLWQPELDTKIPRQVIQEAHPTQEGDDTLGKKGVLDLSFSPSGVWLASGGADRTLKLWRVENNQLLRYLTINTSNDITGVAFSHDSRLLAMSSRADTDVTSRGITVWDMPVESEGQVEPSQRFKTDQGHEGSVLTVAINPKNSDQIASGGVDGKINLWNASGKLIRTLNEHTDPVTQVAFSQDGLFLASSSNDGTVRLWTAKGDLISVLERHERAVSSLEFGPDNGELLASSSFDTDVLLWTLWDLSNVGMTVHNQNQKILTMLISKGCESAEKYLTTRQKQQANKQHRPEEISTTEQESLKELQKIHKFCSQR